MVYLDTSFIVPYYLEEATSKRVETFLLSQPAGSLMVSRWGKVEFASMLARNVRMEMQEAAKARALFEVFEQDLGQVFRVYAPTPADFDLAAELTLREPRSGLRGADALHLAVAKQQNAALYTLDSTLLRVAQGLGVAASDAGILN